MIEVGSRVMYVRNDNEIVRSYGFYPPFGTCGTVLDNDGGAIKVRWDSGTNRDGVWWCSTERVKEVKE